MVYQARFRKRIKAIRRAPDGSAFQKCDQCGESVAIALADMHECESQRKVKRSRGEIGNRIRDEQRFVDQPRSAFRFFIGGFQYVCWGKNHFYRHIGVFSRESLKERCEAENHIDFDRKGYEIWKKMSQMERQLYVLQAEMVNSAHVAKLLKEMNEISQADDEANSHLWNDEEDYENYEYHDDSDCYISFESSDC